MPKQPVPYLSQCGCGKLWVIQYAPGDPRPLSKCCHWILHPFLSLDRAS